MTGLLYDHEQDGLLTARQEDRLAAILISVGLSNSQAEQIVRRMNESFVESTGKDSHEQAPR